MKKRHVMLVILLVLLLIALVAGYFVRQNRTDSVTEDNLTYNPNYVAAIQQNKPELCQSIGYAVSSGPTDGLYKSYGTRAVATCEDQARLGYIGCMCDSNALLKAMAKQ